MKKLSINELITELEGVASEYGGETMTSVTVSDGGVNGWLCDEIRVEVGTFEEKPIVQIVCALDPENINFPEVDEDE